MGRKPRVLVPAVLYHIYERVSSGEPVFAEEEAARAIPGGRPSDRGSPIELCGRPDS